MKKRAIIRTVVLSALILLVLVAMHLPWAFWVVYSGPDFSAVYVYELDGFLSAWWNLLSFVLTLLALLFTLFSVRYRAFNYVCGSLLLSASVSILYRGITISFNRFTPLTWGIVAMLAVLGLWTLITSFKKPKTQNTEQAAPQA